MRKRSGIDEGDEVVVEASKDLITIRPMKPKIVDIDPKFMNKLLSEEYRMEVQKEGGAIEKRKTLHDSRLYCMWI